MKAMTRSMVFVSLVAVTGWMATEVQAAELALPAMFGDHMVLQRDLPVPVWGKARVGDAVAVTVGGQTQRTVADANGAWRVMLSPMKAGGPLTMVVQAGEQTQRIEDVLVGEVWLCSGQSNMAWPVRWAGRFDAEKAAATHKRIRMLTVPRAFEARPVTDIETTWVVTSPETVGAFSAVGYFFGRELHTALDVPIGLIHSAVGGTRIEPWISREGLQADAEFAAQLREMDAAAAAYERRNESERKLAATQQLMKWREAVEKVWDRTARVDPGIKQGWYEADHDDSDWRALPLSNTFEHAGVDDLQNFDGVVWLRTEVHLPESWLAHELTLHLPPIDDSDTTYFQGQQIGRTTWQWAAPREYTIPAGLVTARDASIAIQAIDYRGAGGFKGALDEIRRQLRLSAAGDVEPAQVPLTGPWKYRVAVDAREIPEPPMRPEPMQHPATAWRSPAALYNGMIAPLVPYAIRGAVWYQGESNASEPEKYRRLLPMLINSWRNAWNQDEPYRAFPFGVVQLANFGPAEPDEPAPGGWAWIRESQLHAAQSHPNTGLVVTIDIGESNDIHPKNKQEVGRRLSLWALATVYGRAVPWSGPVYAGMTRDQDRVILKFDHAAGLQTRDGKAPAGFAIAGADGEFVWAEAKIEGDAVVVWSDEVKSPTMVRYGWAGNPAGLNLVNEAGLPASPFRTDDAPPAD